MGKYLVGLRTSRGKGGSLQIVCMEVECMESKDVRKVKK